MEVATTVDTVVMAVTMEVATTVDTVVMAVTTEVATTVDTVQRVSQFRFGGIRGDWQTFRR